MYKSTLQSSSITTLFSNGRSTIPRALCRNASRSVATAARRENREGDISDAFASLEGDVEIPLDPRFAALKRRLEAGKEKQLQASWHRLLEHLKEETALVREKGSSIVPEVAFTDVRAGTVSDAFKKAYKERGVCVVRGVLPQEEALGLKASVSEYMKQNPHTRAFPARDPQVYELYWSEAQMRARGHPNLLDTQTFLMGFWHAELGDRISMRHPVAYADRLRMRKPGDSSFALGPHMDGGSLERWEDGGYSLGGGGKGTYSAMFEGKWEEYDAWDAGARLGVVSDLYGGVGNCSAFRMAQGWLSMSDVQAGEGHLLVNPMLRAATAYLLLRPFFEAIKSEEQLGTEAFLNAPNWRLEQETTSRIQGASPGHGQSLAPQLHPHLQLPSTMVHMPPVRPGDYVAWHCDTIHAVDSVHNGHSDSSVLYIPACPLSEHNGEYLAQQRGPMLLGKPSPDFGGGEGESRHVGRPGKEELDTLIGLQGLRALGLKGWDLEEGGLRDGEREVMKAVNSILEY